MAIFGGAFYGRVDKNRAAGVFGVEVNYDELPIASGHSTAITGSWQIRTIKNGEFKGTITGTLTYNGDKTYRVSGTLEILEGGKGNFYLVDGELDHGPTIPTIVGTLVQKKPQQ